MARSCWRFDARSDIHATAYDALSIYDKVANIDAYAKQHSPIHRNIIVVGFQLFLHFQCTLDCVNRAGKFGKEVIANHVDNTTAMLSYKTGDNAPVCIQHVHRRHFICGHQPRVTNGVCAQYGGKSSFYVGSRHESGKTGADRAVMLHRKGLPVPFENSLSLDGNQPRFDLPPDLA
jgi:hypothetical protein